MAKAYVPNSQLVRFHTWLTDKKSALLLELWLYCKTGKTDQMASNWALKREPHGPSVKFLSKSGVAEWGKEPFKSLQKDTIIRKHQEACREAERKEHALSAEREAAEEDDSPAPAKKPRRAEKLADDERTLYAEALAFLLKQSDPEVATLYQTFCAESSVKQGEDDGDFVGEDTAKSAARARRMRAVPKLRKDVISRVLWVATSGRFAYIDEAADGLAFVALTASPSTHPHPDLLAAVSGEEEGGAQKPTTGRWFKQDSTPGVEYYFAVDKGPPDIAKGIKAALHLAKDPRMSEPPAGIDGLTPEDIGKKLDLWIKQTRGNMTLERGRFWFSKERSGQSKFIFILHRQDDRSIDRLLDGKPFLTGRFEQGADKVVTLRAKGAFASNRDLIKTCWSDTPSLFGKRPVVVQGAGFVWPEPPAADTKGTKDTKGTEKDALRDYVKLQIGVNLTNRMLGMKPSGRFWFAAKGLDGDPVLVLYAGSLPSSVRGMAQSAALTGTWTRNDAATPTCVTLKVDGTIGGARSALTDTKIWRSAFPGGYKIVLGS